MQTPKEVIYICWVKLMGTNLYCLDKQIFVVYYKPLSLTRNHQLC